MGQGREDSRNIEETRVLWKWRAGGAGKGLRVAQGSYQKDLGF